MKFTKNRLIPEQAVTFVTKKYNVWDLENTKQLS